MYQSLVPEPEGRWPSPEIGANPSTCIFHAPSGTYEPSRLPRINAEVVAILKETDVIAKLRTFGNEPKPTTPMEFKARMVADVAKWTAVVESTNFERI